LDGTTRTLVLNRDQELWAVALWVEKNLGDQGTTYISGQIERLASINADGGVAMWREVADRLERLRRSPGAGETS
jgi:hypothetical protein